MNKIMKALTDCRCGGPAVAVIRRHPSYPVKIACERCGAQTAWEQNIKSASYWWTWGRAEAAATHMERAAHWLRRAWREVMMSPADALRQELDAAQRERIHRARADAAARRAVHLRWRRT